MTTPQSAMMLAERLRHQAAKLRVKPTPLADLIPLLQQAADALAAMGEQDTEPVQCGKWQGAEYWMPLAWALCAEECGEDACTELVWEGGPIPEPWGDRWLKYEDEAKRLIALVKEHTAPQPAAPAQDPAEWLLGHSKPGHHWAQVPDEPAAPAPVIPHGWVLVPVKPTDEMLVAPDYGRLVPASGTHKTSRWQQRDKDYTAMILAAPKYTNAASLAQQPELLEAAQAEIKRLQAKEAEYIERLETLSRIPASPVEAIIAEYGLQAIDFVADFKASLAQQPAREVVPLTEAQIEKGREVTFSTNNPFCPCDSKTMRKAVRWAERAHGIGTKGGE